MNMVRCLLSEKGMPRILWPEAARWTAHILNRSYTKAVKDMVPEERWSGIKPKVDYFKVFGSVGHVHIPEQRRIKLDDRSHQCILLGISDESKAYRLYNPVTNKITVSRDVIFEEDAKWNWDLSSTEPNTLAWGEGEDETYASDGEETDEEEENAENTEEAVDNEDGVENETEVVADAEAQEEPEDTTHELGESLKRQRRPPGWMSDFVSGEEIGEEISHFAMYISSDNPLHYFDAAREEKWRLR